MSSKKDKDKKDKDDKKEDGKPSPRITQAAQPIFGIPLEEAARRTDELGAVPSPLRKAVEYLNKRGAVYFLLFTPPHSNRLSSMMNDNNYRAERGGLVPRPWQHRAIPTVQGNV